MLSKDIRRLSVQRAFWSGAARAFDLFGLFSDFGGPLSGARARLGYEKRVAPLPPPEVLREYESLLPGTAQRLFDDYEKQSNHRIQMESDTITDLCRALLLGQWISYSLAMTVIVLAGVLAVWGRPLFAVPAVGLVIIPIASLPTAHFIADRRRAGRKLPS